MDLFSSMSAPEIDKAKNEISGSNIPVHVAIIMDGNGRWAQKRNLPRNAGHKAGVESLREVIAACIDFNIKYLTVYSLSSENWNRPKKEIQFLLNLFLVTLKNELKLLHEHGVRLRLIGDREGIPREVLKAYEDAEKKTSDNRVLNFNIALNYGSRQEIVKAVKDICRDLETKKINPSDIGVDMFSDYLYTRGIPDPDLLIRTSGEFRISNYLLWQISYTELYFTTVLWPDFKRKYFVRAIKEYQNRHRRFGKV